MSRTLSQNIKSHPRKKAPMAGSCYEILTFLTEHDKTRFSRVDAYCYLLDRAFYGYMTDKSVDSERQDGSNGVFTTSIMELAKVWNWQRSSVRRFIDGLEQIRHVKREQTGKHFILHVLCAPMTLLPIHTWSEETWMMAADILAKSIRSIKRPSQIDTDGNFSETELMFLDCIYGQAYKSFMRHEQMEVDAKEDNQEADSEDVTTSPRLGDLLLNFL